MYIMLSALHIVPNMLLVVSWRKVQWYDLVWVMTMIYKVSATIIKTVDPQFYPINVWNMSTPTSVIGKEFLPNLGITLRWVHGLINMMRWPIRWNLGLDYHCAELGCVPNLSTSNAPHSKGMHTWFMWQWPKVKVLVFYKTRHLLIHGLPNFHDFTFESFVNLLQLWPKLLKPNFH